MWKYSIAVLLFFTSCSQDSQVKNSERDKEEYRTWEVRGGSAASIRYSALEQIDTTNVGKLEMAWSYRTGDIDSTDNTEMQNNPIIVDGILYGASPKLKIFALDASTGEEKWVFDPNAGSETAYHHKNRAVVYWEDDEDRRILFTAGPFIYAINADDGSLVEEFGDKGKTSFKQGLGDRKNLYLMSTSPGIIYEDLLIYGSTPRSHTPGNIRAFNVRTGELAWSFNTIPQPGEFGYDTWEDPQAWKKFGHAGSWPGLSLDKQRGIVYVPTGSASSDFYGGNRKGDNLFANTLLALDASTGERVWHFQTVHHDLWDYDLPSPPSLVTVTHDGEEIDAVAQTTKTGFIFLFNRETGEPLFPVEEKSVPNGSPLDGEQVSPTQPYPTRPEPFVRQSMSEDDINPYVSEEVQQQLREQLQSLNNDHMFDPPSLRGTLVMPGFDGGAEWGGSAFDPETGILYVNSNEVPWTMTMIPAGSENDDLEKSGSPENTIARGKQIYMDSCISCHGPERQGGGHGPSLYNVSQRYDPDEILTVINAGRGMMPGFKNVLSEGDKKSLVNYLHNEEYYNVEKKIQEKEPISSDRNPYQFTGHRKFQTPEGLPANSPPWGTLNAIDLDSGEYVWRIPLGEYPELREQGIPPTGTENYGGPVVTAGGIVFTAATLDEKIRAFDKLTGRLLWEHDLPAAGYATPSVNEIEGKQYVVIACGGGKLGTPSGDAFIAFSLPQE